MPPSTTPFLYPVLALIIWTLLIWILMYWRRIPAMNRAKINPDTAKSPDGDWKSKLPDHVQYPAHNYNHLLEQPVIFYALMFYLALTGQMSDFNLYLGWAYVMFRVLHSLVQVTSNKVMIRFSLFALGSIVLMIMTFRAFLVAL